MKLFTRSFKTALAAGLAVILFISLSAGTILAATVDQETVLAGHLLRRIGFGPTKKEIKRVKNLGWDNYIDEQLNPASLDDSVAEAKLPPPPDDFFDDYNWILRWYSRMAYSRRQLQEKMTLVWHEHFATSDSKVGNGGLMNIHEELLRKYALGSFRTFLVRMTKDQAMLIWLDNDYNSGNDFDDLGNPIPPNENYARELLQLFTMGTDMLNMDGTPVLDQNGVIVPAYTENDVREVARALTGWHVDYDNYAGSQFETWLHDEGNKTIMGHLVTGRTGMDGANEVQDVVDIIMQHPSTAPFISKMLIQKLATETPTPGYVERVATVFKNTNGNIKETVRAILTDDEFISDDVVFHMHKEPVELMVGWVRGLKGATQGEALLWWSYNTRQTLYYPPTVFSFYRPGHKDTLLNTATVTYRDKAADDFVSGWSDTFFKPKTLKKKFGLNTPDKLMDWLEMNMLAASMSPELRSQVLAYMNGRIDDTTIRGAVWLVLCSPEFQRN